MAESKTPASRWTPQSNTLVIGIGHKARQGKDAVARALMETWPALVTRFAFADALKAIARADRGMTAKDARLLQALGLEYRQKDIDTLVRTVYWQIVDDAPRVAVITDVRFQNEIAFIKQMGGVCVRVDRRDADGTQLIDGGRPANHPSEVELETFTGWDYVIENVEGDRDGLRRAAIAMFTDAWDKAAEASAVGVV